jgi:hypothetical protein
MASKPQAHSVQGSEQQDEAIASTTHVEHMVMAIVRTKTVARNCLIKDIPEWYGIIP